MKVTRRSLLSLPFVAPLAKALGVAVERVPVPHMHSAQARFMASKVPEVCYSGGQGVPRFAGMSIIVSSAIPKNSVLLYNERSWAAIADGKIASGDMP